MHLKRWITSLTALPLVIFLIYKGGAFCFTLSVCAISILGLWEYFRIIFTKMELRECRRLLFVSYITGIIIILLSYQKNFNLIPVAIALHFILSGIIAILFYKQDLHLSNIIAKQTLGILYIPVLLSFIVLIRNSANGITWIFFLLLLVSIGDVGAFYIGTFFGRHKLCPSISPGKTIEGAAGGAAAVLITGIVFKFFFLSSLSWPICIIFFILISLTAPMGDLFESMLKREGGVKDSGTLLPGHGGILDRIDALLFAAPLAYCFKAYLLRL